MTPEEFNKLSLDERGEYTFLKGKYFQPLDLYSKQNKLLYMVYGMIIEVIFNKETYKVEDIQAWRQTKI